MTLYQMEQRPQVGFSDTTVETVVVNLETFVCATPCRDGSVDVVFGRREFHLTGEGWTNLKRALGTVARRGFNSLGEPEPPPDPCMRVESERDFFAHMGIDENELRRLNGELSSIPRAWGIASETAATTTVAYPAAEAALRGAP